MTTTSAYALWALGISAVLCSKRIYTGRRTRCRVPLNQATEYPLGAATHTIMAWHNNGWTYVCNLPQHSRDHIRKHIGLRGKLLNNKETFHFINRQANNDITTRNMIIKTQLFQFTPHRRRPPHHACGGPCGPSSSSAKIVSHVPSSKQGGETNSLFRGG